MSEHATDLLNAIASGDNDSMNAAFNTAMNAKLYDSLQAKKIELANGIYNGVTQAQEPEETIAGAETEVASDNGTEEV